MKRPLLPLVLESVRVALAMRLVSITVLALSAAVPMLILAVVGANLQAQRAVLAKIDGAGAKIITLVAAPTGAGIPPDAVRHLRQLAGVDWVVALGPVHDVQLTTGTGTPTPARPAAIVGAPVLTTTGLDRGALVGSVSATSLGLESPHGAVGANEIPVLGWFRADSPLEDLNSFVLVPHSEADPFERIVIAVDSVGWVDAVASQVATISGVAIGDVNVEKSRELLAARKIVESESGANDRRFVLSTLLVLLLSSSFVVLAGTLAGRRDFGRRRALGSTRTQLGVLVLLSAIWPAITGAGAGVFAGIAYLQGVSQSAVDWRFPVATAVLTVTFIGIAALVPAVIAATRDPLRVLRVP